MMTMMQYIRNRIVSVYVEIELVVEYADENGNARYARDNDDAIEVDSSHDIEVQQIKRVIVGSGGESEDQEYELTQESEIDDNVEDDDFSSKDEEHLEAIRHLRSGSGKLDAKGVLGSPWRLYTAKL
ncbi:conserved hypothetical protein [Ricinus communis]|uniref:Uncharacterized protein n=1 Tax=Ricinus communis TaxID=3988 RepID=B9T3R6_RICCO|nr:conserved hypothetical protein [Ricinus communis]